MSYTVSLSKNADNKVSVLVTKRKHIHRNCLFPSSWPTPILEVCSLLIYVLYWYSIFISDDGEFLVTKSELR